MRVAVWRGVFQASFLYRLGLPLNSAGEQGLAEVAFRDWDSTQGADVLVSQRVMEPHHVSRWLATEAPLKVLDYDDDLLGLRPDNGMVQSIGVDTYQREWVPGMARALAATDLVTVSVPYLVERLRQHTDAPIVVLPNTVHGSLLRVTQAERASGEPLRVGWAGTSTHNADWAENVAGITRGLKAAKATMVIVGQGHGRLLDYPVEARPWSESLSDYYTSISDFHVMLAPLRDDEFNRSKSPIKALEAAALGIPTIASASGPYLDFVIDGESGFLCRSRSDWERALRTLAYDEELRRRMGEQAREVASGFVTSDWAARWTETYREALAATSGTPQPAASS